MPLNIPQLHYIDEYKKETPKPAPLRQPPKEIRKPTINYDNFFETALQDQALRNPQRNFQRTPQQTFPQVREVELTIPQPKRMIPDEW